MIDICLLNGITEFQDARRLNIFRDNAQFKDGVLFNLNADLHLREPPTGLMILAKILEERGYSVDIIDTSILQDPMEYIKKNIQKYRLIGITALTNTFKEILQLTKIIKQEAPKSYIVMGGPHVSFEYKNILTKNPEIDIIIIGEAENSFPWVIDQLLKEPLIDFIYDGRNNEIEKTINHIGKIQRIFNPLELIPKGIAYKRSIEPKNDNREIIIRETGFPDAVDLSKVPLPARHLISRIYTVADIIINRGCPFKCSFCSRTHLFPQMRIRPVEQVLIEAKYVSSCANYRFVNFYDNININHRYLDEFLEGLIAQKFSLPWGAELRADVITKDEALKLKKANCKIIATGVESASPEVLKANFKFQDPIKVANGIRIFKEVGLAVQAYFVIGLPSDTLGRFEQTLEFVEALHLKSGFDRIEFFVATPYPGSDLAMNPEKYGIKIIDRNFSNFNCRNIIMETPTLNERDITKMINKANNLKQKLHFKL